MRPWDFSVTQETPDLNSISQRIIDADIAEILTFEMNTIWVTVGYDNNDNSGEQERKTLTPGGIKYLDTLING